MVTLLKVPVICLLSVGTSFLFLAISIECFHSPKNSATNVIAPRLIPAPTEKQKTEKPRAERPQPKRTDLTIRKEVKNPDSCLADIPAEATALTESLHALHHISVRSFESMPSFGANRASFFSLSYSDYRLPAKHVPKLYEIRSDWRNAPYMRVRDHGTTDAIEGFEAWTWLYAMHRLTPRGFVYRDIDLQLEKNPFGPEKDKSKMNSQLIVGMPMTSGTLDLEQGLLSLEAATFVKQSDRLWKLQSMDLVSLLKHDPPAAYVWIPEDSSIGKISTRKLDEIEIKSLQQLREGKDHVLAWNPECSQLQFIGAIRAKDSCTRCHEKMKVDDLLGAFTYLFEEDAESAPLPVSRQQPE